jgi:hypothetical protein
LPEKSTKSDTCRKILDAISLHFNLKIISQQQFDFESEHPHVGSEFRSIPFMMPAAHPTPDFTDIACTGQFNAHAPHSIQ